MRQNGVDPTHPITPRFHGPHELSVRGIIESHPCPQSRDQYVGSLLLESAPELVQGLNRARTITQNRLAANPDEVAKLDLSHVVFREQ